MSASMVATWADVRGAVWLAGFFVLGLWLGRVFRHGVRLTLAAWAYRASWRLERVSDWLIGSAVRAGRDR